MGDAVISQIIVAAFLLALGGVCGWTTNRLTKLADDRARDARELAVLRTEVEHLKDKQKTQSGHIDNLFEMKTTLASVSTEVRQLAELTPAILDVLKQMTAYMARKAA